MACRFVRPDVVRVSLSQGDWIELKRELAIGEAKRAAAAVNGEYNPTTGFRRINIEQAGRAQVLAYLVGWSLRDEQDRPVLIDDEASKAAAVDRLRVADYQEIENAVDAHIEREAARQADEKKTDATPALPQT